MSDTPKRRNHIKRFPGQSLYDQATETWDNINSNGYTSLVAMSKIFTSCADLDRALGFLCASNRWHRGATYPGPKVELLAAAWMKVNGGAEPAKRDAPPLIETPTNLTIAAVPQVPVAQPQEPPAKPAADTLFIAVPAGQTEKVTRILAMIGCEVVSI